MCFHGHDIADCNACCGTATWTGEELGPVVSSSVVVQMGPEQPVLSLCAAGTLSALTRWWPLES
jgi:hypothetical protein